MAVGYLYEDLDLGLDVDMYEYRNIEGEFDYAETFGPFPKGFTARISLSTSIPGDCVTTSIYVSKNNEPFALKASGPKSAIYTIE